jgi:predicted  nucleic acid-binding Zn-ribbon protein
MNFDSEKIIHSITNSHKVSNTNNDSKISEKERQQYEHRINDLHKEIDFLRKAIESALKKAK